MAPTERMVSHQQAKFLSPVYVNGIIADIIMEGKFGLGGMHDFLCTMPCKVCKNGSEARRFGCIIPPISVIRKKFLLITSYKQRQNIN
jgi:hypothetical protein